MPNGNARCSKAHSSAIDASGLSIRNLSSNRRSIQQIAELDRRLKNSIPATIPIRPSQNRLMGTGEGYRERIAAGCPMHKTLPAGLQTKS